MVCFSSSARWSSFALLLAAGTSAYSVTSAQLLARTGATLPGLNGNVSSLNAGIRSTNGQIAFTGSYVNSAGAANWFLFAGNQAVVRADDLPAVSAAEATVGISNAGDYVYSFSVSGIDSVRNSSGVVLEEGDAVPTMPGFFTTFASRPRMADDGTIFVVAGFTNTAGGATQGRVLLRRGTDGTWTEIQKSGDPLPNGQSVSATGVEFGYAISGDGTKTFHSAIGANSPFPRFLIANGTVVASVGSPLPFGGNFQNLTTGALAINNSGEYAFAGDTDENTAIDHFVSFGGALVAREGGSYAGVSLAGLQPRNVALNDAGGLVHTWGNTSQQHLFFTPTGDLAAGLRVIGTGDEVDLDGDGIADAVVSAIRNLSTSSSHTIWLNNDGNVVFTATLDPIGGGAAFDAILMTPVPEPATLAALGLGALALVRRRRRG
ncbi:MAG: PEP-CTERM sorting domain-containing protein [Fimbriimonadaceae bacterium]